MSNLFSEFNIHKLCIQIKFSLSILWYSGEGQEKNLLLLDEAWQVLYEK